MPPVSKNGSFISSNSMRSPAGRCRRRSNRLFLDRGLSAIDVDGERLRLAGCGMLHRHLELAVLRAGHIFLVVVRGLSMRWIGPVLTVTLIPLFGNRIT